MQYVAGVLTGGLKQLWNGRLKPSVVVEAFKHEEPEVFHVLREVPSSAEAYVESDPESKQRWAWLIEYIRQKSDDEPESPFQSIYDSPYFKTDDSSFPPFHLLCTFYRTYIYSESRMLLLLAEHWFNELEVSLLKYELYHLKYNLISLLKGVQENLSKQPTDDADLVDKLDHYLNRLLFDQLIILLLELDLRYRQLLDKPLSLHSLYLEYLEQPVPETFSWNLTCAGMEAQRQRVIQKEKEYLSETEYLLNTAHQCCPNCDAGSKREWLKMIQDLENTWLCAYLMVKPGWLKVSELSDTDENERRLNKLAAAMETPDKLNEMERAFINRLVRRLSLIQTTLSCSDVKEQEKASAAWMIIQKAESELQPAIEDEVKGNQRNAKKKLTEDYISFYQISTEFGTSERWLKDKLDEHRIPYTQMANGKWLTKSDYDRFLQLQTTNQKQL